MRQKGKGGRDGCPRRPDHVVWKVLEGRGILLNIEDGSYFEANPTALAVWQQCDGRTAPEKIAAGVAREFRVDPERAEKDVAAFLRELRRRQLLATTRPPSSR